MITRETVVAAMAAEKEAHAAFVVARDHRISLEEQRASELHGVRVGDRVLDKNGRLGVVARIRAWEDGRPWVYANQIKKDGSQGERVLSMYGDWKVVPETELLPCA